MTSLCHAVTYMPQRRRLGSVFHLRKSDGRKFYCIGPLPSFNPWLDASSLPGSIHTSKQKRDPIGHAARFINRYRSPRHLLLTRHSRVRVCVWSPGNRAERETHCFHSTARVIVSGFVSRVGSFSGAGALLHLTRVSYILRHDFL